jgi:hypothetical protein
MKAILETGLSMWAICCVFVSAHVATFDQAKERADRALSSQKTGDGAPLRWGSGLVRVSTFPKS